MAFPANDKMIIQLSYTKKAREVQIRAQMKKCGAGFLSFSKIENFVIFFQNLGYNFGQNLKIAKKCHHIFLF